MFTKEEIKRGLSALLAFAMVLMIFPLPPLEVHAAEEFLVDGHGITDLEATSDRNESDNICESEAEKITIKAKSKQVTSGSGCNQTTKYEESSVTLTLKNTSGTKATLSFALSGISMKSGNTNGNTTCTVAGATGTNGVYTVELENDGTVTVTLKMTGGEGTAPATEYSNGPASVTLSNISLVVQGKTYKVTFQDAGENGSYHQINGETTAQVEGKTIDEVASGTKYTLKAEPTSGYIFSHWSVDKSGIVTSYTENPYTLEMVADTVIVPVFVREGSAKFGVGSQFFYDLNEANAAASTGNTKTIILLNDGTLYSGDYTISDGNTLLIPYNDANRVLTTAPESVEIDARNGADATPKQHRRLTMASGANITVEGSLSVGGQQNSVQGYNGTPTGKVGFIEMQSGSSIVLENGGDLYAWGYIIGNGTIDAKSGSTVYEGFQLTDFRGGNCLITNGKGASGILTGAKGMVDDPEGKHVFPMSQYYIQNIEVLLTLRAGASEKAYMATNAGGLITNEIAGTAIPIISNTNESMFQLTGGTISKDFNESTGKLEFVITNGTLIVNPINMTMKMMGQNKTISSSKFVLPIPGHMSVAAQGTGSVTINQDLSLLPGARFTIDNGVSCTLGSGHKIVVYDADEWAGYTGWLNLPFCPLPYAPGRTNATIGTYVDVPNGGIVYTLSGVPVSGLSTSGCEDATVVINGSIDASAGAVYTTEGGANIYTTGTGVIKTTPGEDEVTYQAYQTGSTPSYVSINVKPAVLKNGGANGTTYTETAGVAANTIFAYCSDCDKWGAHVSGQECCEHSFTDNCDAECNICKATRTPPHSYGTDWANNETHHWHVCACGATSEEIAHADEKTKNHLCDECGYVMSQCSDGDEDHYCDHCGEEMTELHEYSNDWSSDGINHWHACTCGDKSEEAAHADVTTKDHFCDTCGYEISKCSDSDDDPDHNCDYCGKENIEGHTPGADDGNCTTPITCTECGEVTTAAKTHTDGTDADHVCDNDNCNVDNITSHVYSPDWRSDDTKHWHECACGAKQGEEVHNDANTDTDHACDICNRENVTDHSGEYTYEDNGNGTHKQYHNCCNALENGSVKHSYTDGKCVCGAVATYTVTWMINSIPKYTEQVEHGKDATAPDVPEQEGYIFSWDHSGKGITSDTTITGTYEPRTDTPYTVRYWLQKIGAPNAENDGNYTLDREFTRTGTTGKNVTVTPEDIAGFSTPGSKSVSISADGSAVVEFHYKRQSFTITWNVNDPPTTGTFQYGADIVFPQVSGYVDKCTTYTFTGWTDTEGNAYTDTTMPAQDLTLTAQFSGTTKHSWKDATCTEPKTCSVCGATEGTATGHPKKEHHEKVDATCVAIGTIEYWSCPDCGKNFSDEACTTEVTDLTIKINPNNHVNKTEHVQTDATCLEVGYTAGTYCKDCDDWISGHEEIPVIGHKNKERHEKVDATCVATGTIEYWSCPDCGKNFSDEACTTEVTDLTIKINPDNHDLKTTEAKAPTCTEIGWDEYVTCQREGCEYTTYAEKAELGHKNKEHHEKVDATCVATGIIEYWSCPDCGKNFSDEACTTEVTELTVEINPDNHVNKSEHVQMDATCLVVGYTAGIYCEDCDKWISGHEEIPVIGHKNKVHHEKVDATCVATGTIEYWSCPDCDKNFSDEACTTEVTDLTIKINPDNHDLKTTEAKAPTCTEIGWDEYVTCQREGCEYTTYAEKPELGHTPGDEATCTTDQICTECEAVLTPSTGHRWSVSYDWKQVDGKWTCVATHTCANNTACTETATGTVTSEVTQTATCIVMGKTTYTAAFTAEWAGEDTKTEQDVALNPDNHADTGYIYEVNGSGNTDTHTKKHACCKLEVETVQHSYTDGKCVCGDVEQVTVTWKDSEGNVIATETVDHGQSATTTEKAPEVFGYTSTLDTTVEDVKKDTTVIVDMKPKTFGIVFMAEDEIVHETTITYNTKVVTVEAPEKEGYKFVGWYDADGKLVTGDTVYHVDNLDIVVPYSTRSEIAGTTTLKAKYEIKTYAITWSVDGTVTTETYEHFQTPSYKDSTDKASDAAYHYYFAGWDADGDGEKDGISTVTGSATYTAVYTQVAHADTAGDGDHLCDQGCGKDLGETCDKEAWTYTDNGDGTHNATCNACGDLNVNNAEHIYNANGECVCRNTAAVKIGDEFYCTLPEAVAAADDGDTILVLKDASGAGAVIDKDITIDFGSYTYSFTEGVGSSGTPTNGFQILQGNEVMLKNGKLNVAEESKDKFYILVQNYADLTVEDMTLDGTNLDKWSGSDGDSYVLSNNSGTVNITGKTNITANNDGDKAFAFDVCKYKDYDAPVVNVSTTGKISGKIEVSEEINDNLNISGGTFTVEIAEAWCAEGYEPQNNGNGTYGVKLHYVAEIDGVQYISLPAAVAAAEPGDTIKLLGNEVGAGAVINKSIIIDFGGYTYTVNSPVGSAGTETLGLQILQGNEVTLKNGTFTANEGENEHGKVTKVLVQNYADLNVVDMQLIGNGNTLYALSNNSGNVKITGNTTIDGKNGVAFDVCKYASYTEPVVTVAETVAIQGKIEAAAKIGNVYYATLPQAVAAAKDGQTVTLLKSTSGAGAVIDKDITIDFGTYTYSFTEGVGSSGTPSNGFQILQGNDVVLKNGTLEVAEASKDKFYILVQNYADLTVEDMTLDGTNLDKWSLVETDQDSYTLSNNSGTVNITGETKIIANNDGDKAFAFDVCKYANYPEPVVTVADTVTIQGKIEAAAKIGNVYYATLPQAIAAARDDETVTLVGNMTGAGAVIDKDITIDFGTYTYSFTEGVGSSGTPTNGFQILQGNEVTLKNGTLNVAEESKDKFYILVQNYADLTVEDMTLDGANLDKWSATDGDSYVLSNNSGTVNITGETSITANDQGDKAFAFDVCKYADYAAPVVNVNITGTISGKIEVSEEIATNLNISGGSFTVEIHEDWCADGFIPKENGDDTYGVQAGAYVAQVNESKKYESLAEAVAAAQDGDTVTLLKETTGAGAVIDKDITIDFGGYTYTVNAPVGSAGSETLGLQILKGNEVTLKNGTFTANEGKNEHGKVTKVLVQNYADLTVEDMNLIGNENILYCLSVNSGNVEVKNSTITAADGQVAFDACKYGTYEIPVVTVADSTITGTVEITGGTVKAVSGVYYVDFDLQSGSLAVSGGSFAEDVTEYCATGYHTVKDDSDLHIYGKCVESDEDEDHVCDLGCGQVLEECVDPDKDHECDICHTTVGKHEDSEDTDHLCDYCQGDVGEDCYDNNNDHKCDECGVTGIGDHSDSTNDGDHLCDYCGQRTDELCDQEAWTYADNGNGTHDATCNACGTQTVNDAYHQYNENGVCACLNTALAQIDSTFYGTLPEAVAAADDGDTILVLKDASGAGAVIDKDITIDFGTYTYSFTEGVGSSGTPTNGFQILQGNDVTLKNGTLNVAEESAENFYILVQNYADLTVEDMTLDGTNLDRWSATDGDSYVLSNNSGTVNITGETSIIANDQGDKAFAFDVCKYADYASPVVNVNITGTISGKIEVSEEIATNLNISGGTFTVEIHEDWCANGFLPLDNEDGTYGVQWDTGKLLKGDLDLDGDVDSDDLTLLARHVGGIEELAGIALENADVDSNGEINSDDLTLHARYVGGIIKNWEDGLGTVAVVEINGEKYGTLADALAAAQSGDTVVLLSDAVDTGAVIDKDITIDFGGYTYTVNAPVGSAGSETLGLQILSGNNVTLKNGTFTANEGKNEQGKVTKMLIQNYANLTLENMNIIGNENTLYALSNNSGTVNIIGATSIDAKDGVAFDVCKFADYKVPVVNVNTTGKITGRIEVSDEISTNLNISGGIFTVEIAEDWCAEGFEPVANEDGTYGVKETEAEETAISEDEDIPDSEDTDIPDSEDTDIPDSEDTDIPDSEDTDIPDSEDTDIPDSEDTDIPDSEDTDTPDSENTDTPNPENTDTPDSESTDTPDSETT